jgi:(E)-4-hydroxy-3-methyl-but-2-enyl pyrophosphate reductase
MENMKIEKAEKLGLCFGVRQAIKLLKGAANKYGEIETLGPLAHNRLVVEELANLGIKPINHLDQAQGRILAITTHGTSPAILSEIRARHIHIVDTTCPIVRKAQNTAKELAETGFDVIIFGEAEHSEVKGLLGWTGDRGIAALNVKQIDSSEKSPSRLGIISQTTQTQSAFVEFARQLMDITGSKIEEMRLVNTLCKVTQGQQEAALRLARKSQLMIVIGGSNSANARHLVEICSPLVETHLVEIADEVNTSWLMGKHHIGITAGASTPDEAVEELIAKLSSL